jgi:hypothetical protein
MVLPSLSPNDQHFSSIASEENSIVHPGRISHHLDLSMLAQRLREM